MQYAKCKNIEILVWRLYHRRNTQGELFLLSTEECEVDTASNLSFDRLFSKMVTTQDMMARIIAGRSHRSLNFVVHSIASATFLPVGG